MILVFFVFMGLVWGFENDIERLSEDTIPKSYALRIVPDLELDICSFAGQVDILIQVKTTTPVILLNSKDLILTDIQIKNESTNRVNVNSWDYIKDRDQVQILLDGYVFADQNYTIRIRFKGNLQRDGTVFFKSNYAFDSHKKK